MGEVPLYLLEPVALILVRAPEPWIRLPGERRRVSQRTGVYLDKSEYSEHSEPS